MIRKSNLIVATPETIEGHISRIDVMEAVKANFKNKPTPLLDAAIDFHRQCIADARGEKLD